MHVLKCVNNHHYDADKYPACPHCGAKPDDNNATGDKENNLNKKSKWRFGKTKDEPTTVSASSVKQSEVTSYDKSIKEEAQVSSASTDSGMHNDDYGNLESFSKLVNEAVNRAEFYLREHEENNDPGKTFSYWDNPIKQIEENPIKKDLVKNDPIQHTPDVYSEKPQPEGDSLKTELEDVGKTVGYFSLKEAVTPVSEGSTVSSSTPNQQVSSEPVVGWLVCINGKHFGESFNIASGKNSIGRNGGNKIVLSKDGSVSREKHALIIYEPKKRNFYLQPGDSSGLTYLNDDYITESRKLCPRDEIELGDSKFIFVPLCDETFSWEDYLNKE